MSDADFPADLIDLQRRSDEAWADVEAHRVAVDERRRRDAAAKGVRADELRPWAAAELEPWTDKDDAAHEEKMAAVLEAAAALRTALIASGLGTGYETVQGLKKAGRKGGQTKKP